eukprot:scaffold32147_cov21-Tisochrysis_lutea.AAC.2
MEKETEKKEKQKEAVSNLEKDVGVLISCAMLVSPLSLESAEQEQNMAALNDVMADTKTGPKAAQGQLGYWIPGGIGNKHKLPKGANQNEAAYAPMAHTGRPSCGQGGARHHQKRQVSGAHVHQVGAVGFSEVWASVACQAASARG